MSDVSKEYGEALFELACSEGLDFELLNQLLIVRDIFTKNPKYSKLLATPDIPKSERVQTVSEAFDGKVHEYVSSFLKLLTERGHARHIVECITEYEKLYYDHQGLIIARVESAVELTDSQKNAILAKLSKKLGSDVVLKCTVNPDLIGGLRILAKDELYEGTVRAKLTQLKKNLADATI